MILSRGRKYLFVHIPKTGGTSLTEALEARAMSDDIIIADTLKGKARAKRQSKLPAKGRLWKHSTIADLEGVVTQDELANLYIVTLVRNPWDRVRSYYAWLQDQSFDHSVVGLAKTLDFDAFVAHPSVMQSFRVNPYGSYVTDWTGRKWPTDYVRLEDLAQELTRFEAHLGFKLDVPHSNRSSKKRLINAQITLKSAINVGISTSSDICEHLYKFKS